MKLIPLNTIVKDSVIDSVRQNVKNAMLHYSGMSAWDPKYWHVWWSVQRTVTDMVRGEAGRFIKVMIEAEIKSKLK